MIVAYHCSDLYAEPTGVSITSLFENNKECDELVVYIIEHDVSANNKKKLLKLAESYGRTIKFIPMPDINQMQDLKLVSVKKNWLFDSYCRLFLDVLLPSEIEKVLYLDGDVLVVDSLYELWNTDMQGHCSAGVAEFFSEKYYKIFNLSKTATYCNSGIILINLKLWREQHISEYIKKYVRSQKGYVFFMEQTVWNVVMQDKILLLNPKYNVSTMMQCLSYKEILLLRKPRERYSRQEIESAVKKPALVHLTNSFLVNNRVWIENSKHPYKNIYLNYRNLSPWKNLPESPDTRGKIKKIIDRIISVLPRRIVLLVASGAYNVLRISNIQKAMRKRS